MLFLERGQCSGHGSVEMMILCAEVFPVTLRITQMVRLFSFFSAYSIHCYQRKIKMSQDDL